MKQIKPETTSTIYCDAKQLAVDYQLAKMEVCIIGFFRTIIVFYLDFFNRSIKPFRKVDSVYGLYVFIKRNIIELFIFIFYLDKTT